MIWAKRTGDGQILWGEKIEGPGWTLDQNTQTGVDGWQPFESMDAVRETFGLPDDGDPIESLQEAVRAQRQQIADQTQRLDKIAGRTTTILPPDPDLSPPRGLRSNP